ncbi:unnamed protein product [Polarella glacialis]|uniref:Uncharacterized protein n=1 Tax=Polarella glacialis TaxID=89957 RepID=A0A813L7L0_POLGL|nr:unnamed protein product [Polarella glacialis]CAE8685779.1 unnamed protein product [Polarella glacialis]CAE8721251.1 unnamed protein product [Polarella glacialis]|mmetsp:Transcript_5942/g.11131  ORF Transcript_5942/g.11131 Transcript_5942/m.11131 type:complete len:348 (-) Transcript_5942:25-1068(-)
MRENGDIDKTTRGQYVEVFGLVSQSGRLLNRTKGIVIKQIEGTGRIEVSLCPEGRVASFKPDCLRLVVGASAEELQDARDAAGPALRAAAGNSEAQQACDISDPADAFRAPERDRSRSWSPPPEAIKAASAAAALASSAAAARGLSAGQAEAHGSAAAEAMLAQARQAARMSAGQPPVAAGQPAPANKAEAASFGEQPVEQGRPRSKAAQQGGQQAPVPNVAAAAPGKGAPRSLEEVQVGHTIQAVGLKGDDKTLNGETGVVKEILGFSHRSRRFVVCFTQLAINANGDLAQQEMKKTLTVDNVCLPGKVEVASSEDSSSESQKRSRRKSKRSRSRRRDRRSRSRRR